MNTFLIQQYIRFLAKSTNQHGVHSPFIFDFVTKCCYNSSFFEEYKTIEEHRKLLLSDTSVISVTDFGAGSKVFKSNNRPVHKIAKMAGIPKRRAKLLFRIANYFNIQNSLEIGTSLGLATAPLSLGNKKGSITSLEGCKNTANKALEALQKVNIHNTQIIPSEFNHFLNKTNLKNTPPFDLIYFDGNHTKKDTLNYFYQLLPYKHNDSIWIFDDIHWSKDMLQAWEIIKQHPEVSVTIDSFYWGIVFFRKEQVKQNFTLRL